MSDALAQSAVESLPVEPPREGRRYCAACLYDLSSLSEPRCPECGRDFNPHDPRTYADRPIPAWRRAFVLYWGLRVLAVLLVLAGFMYTVLPRPRNLLDWRLWVWFGRPIGVIHGRGASHDVYAYFWFGTETRRESFNHATGALAWRVAKTGEHWYTVEVAEPGVRSEWIMNAFNAIKGNWFFGVSLGRSGNPIVSEAFECKGDETEVLGRLVGEFVVPLRPFRLTESQPYVWTYDFGRRAMATVEVTPALADEFPVNRQDADRVLIPRHERHARIGWRPGSPMHPDQGVE